MLSWLQNDFDQAEECCSRSLALFRAVEDCSGVAMSLALLGLFSWRKNGLDYAASVVAFWGSHQSRWAGYQSIVSARPCSRSGNLGCQPSSSRSFPDSIA